MAVALVTGSGGLIGSESVSFFAQKGFAVIGIDNNMRKAFFGKEGSVIRNQRRLRKKYKNYQHYSVDIRHEAKISKIFKKYGPDIVLVIHAASQPSHDWSARGPMVDFGVNALGTLVLLEALRKFCPKATFIFISTNKVYGDTPNRLPLIEEERRFELPAGHKYYQGIDESMGIDYCLHSPFGASKLAADVMVQEYGRYFGLKTGVFRAGCLSGPQHAGVEAHGFLSYLVKCAVSGRKYQVFGYKGKQVRDNIHAYDLVSALYHFFKLPRPGEVYNMGGGRFANISLLEAIELCEKISGKKFNHEYTDKNRTGDHLWWISNVSKFKSHYPEWQHRFGIEDTLKQIYAAQELA